MPRKLLFVRIHQLAALSDAEFCAGFDAIVAAIETDLAHEERVMDTLAFDGLHERLAENALLLGSLHCIVTHVEAGDATLGRTALAAAADLLSLHRLTTDLALVLARPAIGGPRYLHPAGPVKAVAGRRRKP